MKISRFVSLFFAFFSGLCICPTTAFAQTWVALGHQGVGVLGSIYSLTDYNGQLCVGGSFQNELDSLGGFPFSASNISTWNGSAWSQLGAGMNDTVTAICNYNGNLIACGKFNSADGYPANSIALWDGNEWNSVRGGLNGPVYAACVYNGNLIVGGHFTQADGSSASNIAEWNGISWLPLGSGMNGPVYAFCI